MTNKDMVPRPGPGPAPRDRSAPKEPRGTPSGATGKDVRGEGNLNDPPDSPQLKPSQDRK